MNVIIFHGGFYLFEGEPTRKIWDKARDLSIRCGKCSVVSKEQITRYVNGKRSK